MRAPVTTARRTLLPALGLVVCSLFAAGGVGQAAYRIGSTFYEHYPYFYDPVGYQLHNVRLIDRITERGQLGAALFEWQSNPRNPLRTTPIILLAPQLLANPLGHLFTSLPMLALYLFVMGWTVYQRTGHWLYALGAMLLFIAIRGMYSPTDGLAAYWLDLPAAFLAGAAGLCLLNSNQGRHLGWLAAFAVCAACVPLSRWTAVVYVAVMCGPILALFLGRRWAKEKDFARAVLLPVTIIGGIVGVLAGYFLVTHSFANSDFYATYVSGFSFNHGVREAVVSTAQSLMRFVESLTMLLILGGLFVLNIALLLVTRISLVPFEISVAKPSNWQWPEQAALAWLAVAHLVTCGLLLRVVGDWRTPLYAWPLLFVIFVAPGYWPRQPLARAAGFGMAVALLAMSLVFGSRYTSLALARAQHPPRVAQERKAFFTALGGALAEQGNRLVWMPFFDTVAPLPMAEAYYRFDAHLLSPTRHGGKTLFNNTEVQDFIWDVDYPGASPQEVGEIVFGQMSQWVDVVVVFEDPEAARDRFASPYTEAIAAHMAQSVQSDPRWTKVFRVFSEEFGWLAGYRNLAPDGGAYDWLLWRHSLSLP